MLPQYCSDKRGDIVRPSFLALVLRSSLPFALSRDKRKIFLSVTVGRCLSSVRRIERVTRK